MSESDGKVPLSCKDPTAQDLLWLYAQRRRAVDAEFATDLEIALTKQGFDPRVTVELTARIRSLEMLVQHMAVGHMHNVEKLDAARDRLSEELKRRPTAAAAGNAAEVLRRTQRAVETASGQGDPILMQRLSKEGIAEALQVLGAVCGGFVEDAAASQPADAVEHVTAALMLAMIAAHSKGEEVTPRLLALAAVAALPPRDDREAWRCSCCGELKPDMPDGSWRSVFGRGGAIGGVLPIVGWQHNCPTNDPQAGWFPASNFGGSAPRDDAERFVEAVRMVMSSSRTDFDVRCTIANLFTDWDAARRAAR